jgi:CO dehydrogenase maturation factor
MFVIDANADSNLPDLMGILVKRTVGTVTEDRNKAFESEISPAVTKEELLENRIFEILIETQGFTCLLGRGEGCYCVVNAVLARAKEILGRP